MQRQDEKSRGEGKRMEKKYIPMNKEEAQFLQDYDPSAFSPIAITVDAVVLGITKSSVENYRKCDKQSLKILLVKRDEYPYKGQYSLPGGFVLSDETLEETLGRTLKSKTGLTEVYSEQLYTFGEVTRDPRMRIVSCAYISLLDMKKAKIKDAMWYELDKIDQLQLAFDQKKIIKEAVKRLKGKIHYTDIVFEMMPEEFTISELQEVYEIVLGEKLIPAAFRRTIAEKIEETGKMTSCKGHRPSKIYRYKKI